MVSDPDKLSPSADFEQAFQKRQTYSLLDFMPRIHLDNTRSDGGCIRKTRHARDAPKSLQRTVLPARMATPSLSDARTEPYQESMHPACE